MFAAYAQYSEPAWAFLAVLLLLALVVLLLFPAVVAVVVIVAKNRRWRRERLSILYSGPPSFRPREHRPAPAREGHCLECATELPADSPDGLCPQCLLKGGLSSAADHPSEDRKPRTTPYPGPFTAPDPAELAAHFPQLEIVELIGQGGMGAVYKARQTKLDRLVALKILPSEWGKDPAFAERFAREARTLARLNHPHIVAVHDFGESGGLYYLVMEFVDGVNLREAMQAGRFEPEQALAVMPQVCDALQYAHEEGVVHRDVKPENILLDKRGRVKIADFGLAKLLNRPRAEFTLTGSRQVMGTVDYMAPEQRSRPLEIDHRADIYSLGVVFYEMLTGELPLGRFAPPSQRSGVDARLDEVVFRALETDPGQRYQSASAVKLDVESIVGGAAPAGAPAVPAGGGRERTELARALRQVQGPAGGLLLAGIATALPSVVMSLVVALSSPRHWLEESSPLGPPPFVCLMMFFISLAPATILVAGALKMRRCEAYELGFIASIVALTPFTGLAWMFTLPMGLWALLVLVKREVREGFALRLLGWTAETGVLRRARTSGIGSNPLRARVRRRLNGPAAAMLAAGIVQCLGQVVLAVPVGTAVAYANYGLLRGEDFGVAWRRGDNPGEMILLTFPGMAFVAAWVMFGLYVGVAMIRAAFRMWRLQSYRLAVKASLLAMLPCTLTSVITLPVGLWSFIVVRDLDVEKAFSPDRTRRVFAPLPPAQRPTGPFRRKARSFLDSMLAMFVTRPGKDYPAPGEGADGHEEPEADRLPERS